MAVSPALLSSERMDWQTPDNVLGLVRDVFDGVIHLDPCTTDENPTRAMYYYTTEMDGMSRPWAYRTIFVNPPYGREIGMWIRRCNALYRADASGETIALVPARTDAGWWQGHAAYADRICFWRGRLVFRGAPSSAPFPSALLYWGTRSSKFEWVMEPHGWIVRGKGK